METTTLSIPAKRYEDHDDCLAAAAEDVARERGLETWQVTAAWGDEERSTIRVTVPDVVRCECGEAENDGACAWTGPRSETVLVEYMPRQHRASHTAAGNSGVYPHNGAVRLRCERECADAMVEADGTWCSIVGAEAA